MTKICANCRYYEPWGDDDQSGQCNRYAPRPVVQLRPAGSPSDIVAIWPSVDAEDRCGEHEPAPA
jgi:hypothetical protein